MKKKSEIRKDWLTRGRVIRGVPLATEPRHFFNNSNTNEDIATKFEQEYVLFFHISYTMR